MIKTQDSGIKSMGPWVNGSIGLRAYGSINLLIHRLIDLLTYRPIDLFYVLCLVSCLLLFAPSSRAQTYQEDTQAAPEVHHESALRRFEIVFTISLPFTALHSYLAVRGVEMVRQRKISPELRRADWNTVGGLTILFSGFIAFWDWLHTRDKDISETMLDTRYPASSIQNSVSSIQNPELRFLFVRF